MAKTEGNGKGGELPRGAYSKIARRLRPKVSPQHVRAVAIGERRSPRIEAAIARYLASLQDVAVAS